MERNFRQVRDGRTFYQISGTLESRYKILATDPLFSFWFFSNIKRSGIAFYLQIVYRLTVQLLVEDVEEEENLFAKIVQSYFSSSSYAASLKASFNIALSDTRGKPFLAQRATCALNAKFPPSPLLLTIGLDILVSNARVRRKYSPNGRQVDECIDQEENSRKKRFDLALYQRALVTRHRMKLLPSLILFMRFIPS